MRAADAVLRYIQGEGVRHVFGNPGTTEIPFMDAMVDTDLKFVLCLQENVAVSAADGLAQASRLPSVCNLHTGPGLAQAFSCLYMASAHRSPIVVTAGNEDTRLALTEPLLHADLVEMARPLVKWAYEPTSVDDVIPSLRRAFKVAKSPPTGPVFLSWPMDVLAREVADDIDLRPADVPASPAPDPRTVEMAAELLAGASSPCIIAGDDVGRTRAVGSLVEVAEQVGARVFTAPLALTQNFPNTHPLSGGNLPPLPGILRAFLSPYDVILALGSRAFLLYFFQGTEPVPPEATLIHVHPDPWEVAKNYPTEVGAVATADLFLEALAGVLSGWPKDTRDRSATRRAKLEAEGSQAREAAVAGAQGARRTVPLAPQGILASVVDRLGDVDVAYVDESVTASFAARQVPDLADEDTFFGHKGGALGWGAGAAVGVALADPTRRVVCTLGDGSLLYCPQALYTAAAQRLPILYIVMNNAGYGIIKSGTRAMKQRAFETDTYIGMDITEPEVDFVSLAHGLGCGAMRAESPDDLEEALTQALAHEGPFLIDCALERTIPEIPF